MRVGWVATARAMLHQSKTQPRCAPTAPGNRGLLISLASRRSPTSASNRPCPKGATLGSTFSMFCVPLPGVPRPARLRGGRPLYPGLEAERPLAKRVARNCSAVRRLLFISLLSLLLYCSRYYFLAQRWVRTAVEFLLMECQPRGCDPPYAFLRFTSPFAKPQGRVARVGYV
jgi:hypothetical protein